MGILVFQQHECRAKRKSTCHPASRRGSRGSRRVTAHGALSAQPKESISPIGCGTPSWLATTLPERSRPMGDGVNQKLQSWFCACGAVNAHEWTACYACHAGKTPRTAGAPQPIEHDGDSPA